MLKRLFGKSDKPAFVWREIGDRLSISLVQSEKPLPFNSWASVRPDAANALNELCSLGDLTEQSAEQAVSVEDACILLVPSVVARLDAPIATLLGLPAPTPLALDLRAQNRIDQDDFRLVVRWVRPGGQPVRAQMKGAILFTDAGPRRVPDPLWSLHAAALPLTRSLEKSERFEALARLKEHWPEDPRLALESEGYLQDLRVHYASSLSLKLKTLTPDRTEFDPVLLVPARPQLPKKQDSRLMKTKTASCRRQHKSFSRLTVSVAKARCGRFMYSGMANIFSSIRHFALL